MGEHTKETGICVSGAKIKEVLSNPDKVLDVVKEFCDDVSALTVSMSNLYEQHPIEFGMLGIQVEVIVRSQALDTVLIHNELGSKDSIGTVLEHPVSDEEAAKYKNIG